MKPHSEGRREMSEYIRNKWDENNGRIRQAEEAIRNIIEYADKGPEIVGHEKHHCPRCDAVNTARAYADRWFVKPQSARVEFKPGMKWPASKIVDDSEGDIRRTVPRNE